MHAHLVGIEGGGTAGNLCLRVVKQLLQAVRSSCCCYHLIAQPAHLELHSLINQTCMLNAERVLLREALSDVLVVSREASLPAPPV